MIRRTASALFLYVSSVIASAETPAVAATAARFVPGVEWQAGSSVQGDFSCRGRKDRAILGTSKSEIVVAIFVDGLDRPPKVLRYSAGERDPTTAELTIEDLDFDPKRFKSEVGELPDGLRPSRTCKGLNLSDGKVDSAHIYWNRKARRFDDWSL